MRVTVKFTRPYPKTPLGSDLRQYTGELDALGILWVENQAWGIHIAGGHIVFRGGAESANTAPITVPKTPLPKVRPPVVSGPVTEAAKREAAKREASKGGAQ